MFDFIKYQSLGNDFVLLDFLTKTNAFIDSFLNHPKWPSQVQQVCDRHFGIGADGILIVRYKNKKEPEAILYNADGSIGKKCLNGLRCIAHYLFTRKNFSSHSIILMNDQPTLCQRIDLSEKTPVLLNIGPVIYQGRHSLPLDSQTITGHLVDAGNPHFVVLNPISQDELLRQGRLIESHPDFPDRTNAEFAWPENETQDGFPVFNMRVFERGCGITLACGSGAAATLTVLTETKIIQPGQKISIRMPGGEVFTYLDETNNIIQVGPAQPIFSGNCRLLLS